MRKLLFLPIMVIISAILGMQAGTQYLAWRFQYHASLGLNFYHIYPFWQGFIWSYHWHDRYPNLFNTALFIGEASLVISVIASAAIEYFGFRHKAKSINDMHGSAHWALREDIENASLLPKKGAKPSTEPTVYVGAWKDKKTKKNSLS